MTWHLRLNTSLQQKGWAAVELARRSGVPYSNLLKYLAGKVDQPRGDTITKLAGALEVDPLWLEKDLQKSLTTPTDDELAIDGEIDFELLSQARRQAQLEHDEIFNGKLSPRQFTLLIKSIYIDLQEGLKIHGPSS